MAPLSDDPFVKLPAVAAGHHRPDPPETWSDPALLHHHQGHDRGGAVRRPPIPINPFTPFLLIQFHPHGLGPDFADEIEL
jgi:hypothetical protein